MSAKFTPQSDGIERCTKRPTIRLTREENAFCVKQTGVTADDPDFGGGAAVDEYIAQLALETIRQRMQGQK